MTTNEQKTPQQNVQRSENLLPVNDTADGRYEVAEEVNLDEQSDAARRVGKAPAGATSEAMGAALQGKDDADADEGGQDDGAATRDA